MTPSQRQRTFSMRGVAILVLGLAVGLSGCGQDGNALDGSIGDVVNLDFDYTQLRLFSSGTIQLDYLKNLGGSGVDVVCKVVFDLPADGIVVGTPIDILENNGIVERVVSAGDLFPELERATLTFSKGGAAAGPATGAFSSTFVSGETLNGNFDAELTEVSF